MNYKQVKELYPSAIEISNILFSNDCTFQISSSTFILYKDKKEVTLTPQINESTLTLISVNKTYIDRVCLREIDADLWFNLSIEYQLPFGYDCIEKLKGTDFKFHILMRIMNES